MRVKAKNNTSPLAVVILSVGFIAATLFWYMSLAFFYFLSFGRKTPGVIDELLLFVPVIVGGIFTFFYTNGSKKKAVVVTLILFSLLALFRIEMEREFFLLTIAPFF